VKGKSQPLKLRVFWAKALGMRSGAAQKHPSPADCMELYQPISLHLTLRFPDKRNDTLSCGLDPFTNRLDLFPQRPGPLTDDIGPFPNVRQIFPTFQRHGPIF